MCEPCQHHDESRLIIRGCDNFERGYWYLLKQFASRADSDVQVSSTVCGYRDHHDIMVTGPPLALNTVTWCSGMIVTLVVFIVA